MSKSPDAFRTISEVAEWLGIQAHVLRFWESKFTQIKPVKRAGGRRYYRPADVDLLGSIKVLLHDQGMAIKDVQALLREHGAAHVASLADPDAPSAAQGSAAASDVEPIENASADPVQGDVIEATVEATFEPVEPAAAPAPTPPAPAAPPGAWAEPASPAPATAAPTPAPAPAPAPQVMPPAAEAPQSAPTPVQADPAQPVQTQPVQTQPVQTQPVQPQPVQTQPQMQAQPQVQPTVQPPAAPPAAASDAAEQAQPTATPTPTPAAPTYAAPVQDGVTQAAAGASPPAAPGPAPIVPTASPSVSVDPVQAAVSETGDIHPPEPQSETALPQTSFGAAAGSSAAVPAYDSAPTAPQPAQSTLFGESTEAPAPSPAAPVSAAPSTAVPVSAAPSSAEPVAAPPAQPATSEGAGEHLQPDLLGDLPQINEPAELIEAADSPPSDLPPVAEVDRLAPAPEDVEAAAVEAPSAPQSPLPQDTAPATPFADAADEPPAPNVTDAPTFAADMPAQTAPQEAPQEAPATDIFAAETAVDAPADLTEPAQPVDEVSDFTQAPAMDPDLGANPAEVEIDLADRTDAPVFDAEADLDDNPLAVAGALDQEPADVAPLDVAEAPAAALVDDLGDDLGGHADPLAEPLAETEDLPDLAALDGVDVDQALHDAPYESEEPTPEDAPLDMFDAPQEQEAEFAADMEAAAEPMAAEDSALDDSAAEYLLAVDPVETVGAETETVAPDDALHDAAQDLTAPMEQLAEISQPIAGAEDAGSLAEEPAQELELELELGDSADVASDAVAFELDLTEAGADQQDAEAETQAPVVTPASEDVAEVEAPVEEIPKEDMSVDMATESAGASDNAPLSDEVSIDLTDDLQGDLPDDLQDDMSAPLADEGVAAEAETVEVAVDAAETDAGDPLADGLGAELVAEPGSDALADMAPLSEPVSDAEPEAIAEDPAPQEHTLESTVADDAVEESTDSQGDQSQAQPLRARVVIVPDLRDGVPEPRAAVLSHLAGLERVPAHLQDEIADCLRALRG
ncbi:MerR family transcriptional regulator [Phaeobacter italicus]|uniref:MerR family transcriptional regulator n=1 Tax=Phaeobacter italicus TaxID=481446 RepID=UPI000669BE5B|nr:MerR family transcriptional regulator [Phaeobacter italicus]CRL13867.1 MerR family regulatory protein [Phaeobacter italicus]SFG07519.1 DNA-binding transcriptional regulator, MerR family [Phaeobacter italicus]